MAGLAIRATLAAVLLAAACGAHGQQAEWQRLNQETIALYRQGQYPRAIASATQAVRVAETTFGPAHPNLATSLNDLAFMHVNQGQYAIAEPLYRRALAIREKALGPDHPAVALILTNLGKLTVDLGGYAEADLLLQRAVAIREKRVGREHPDVAASLVGLAGSYRVQGRYAQAESLYKRSLAIVEKALGPEHPHVASVLNQLALTYLDQGRFAQVESIYKRTLAIREKALGPEHDEFAVSLHNMAELYTRQGRYAEAEPLRNRALAVTAKALGPAHPHVGLILATVAHQHALLDQHAEAETVYKRSLAILESALDPAHRIVGNILRELATVSGKLGRYEEAIALFRRALAIAESSFGPQHADVATVLHREAELHQANARYALAEPLYRRSLAIIENIVGPDHPGIALSLNGLAGMYRIQARHAEGLALARRASAVSRHRILAGGSGDLALREAFASRSGFLNHLALLAHNPDRQADDAIADEALQIVQLEQTSGTASAVAKMAARFSAGDDVLAGLVRRKQDAVDRRSRDEAQLVKAASRPPEQREAAVERRLREDIVLLEREVATVDAELTRDFPDYQELTRHEPLVSSRIRALLRPGEALLVYSLGERGFLWVVRPEGVAFIPLQAEAKDLGAKVAEVRSAMEFNDAGRAPRVSLGVLHELYRKLFAPAVPHLAGARHLMVVPSGPLQSLPFSMLVASAPPEIRSDADYREVDWLAKHYAFSVLPAVGSIRAFRQFAGSGRAQEPFAGFGDPLIGVTDRGARTQRSRMDVAQVFRNLAVKANALTGATEAEIADVEAIRQAPRLPETADELRAMGAALKAGPNSIWLQKDASETRVKSLDLSKYRTIAFATHGVMAGELRGVGEPGLILTPPPRGSIEDDGYLSASEIARLKLSADWVVLSACNTAAADGTPGAEGLSGLAKSFFYAGARSLLVSHWPVASEATVPLTTFMLREYEANPGQGKAEAHRKAMLALMNTQGRSEYAHPLFWAPFVVVGEGGAAAPVNP